MPCSGEGGQLHPVGEGAPLREALLVELRGPVAFADHAEHRGPQPAGVRPGQFAGEPALGLVHVVAQRAQHGPLCGVGRFGVPVASAVAASVAVLVDAAEGAQEVPVGPVRGPAGGREPGAQPGRQPPRQPRAGEAAADQQARHRDALGLQAQRQFGGRGRADAVAVHHHRAGAFRRGRSGRPGRLGQFGDDPVDEHGQREQRLVRPGRIVSRQFHGQHGRAGHRRGQFGG